MTRMSRIGTRLREHTSLESFLAAQDAFAAKHPGGVCVGDAYGFSNYWCDCCESQLAGDRHFAHTLVPSATGGMEIGWEGKICTDCTLFHANGDLPDLPSFTPCTGCDRPDGASVLASQHQCIGARLKLQEKHRR